MKSASKNKTALLIIDILIILFGIAGLYQNYIKATLPFSITTSNNHLIITSVEKNVTGISIGDTVLTIDNNKLTDWEEAEMLTDGKYIGDEVNVKIRKAGAEFTKPVLLINFYSIAELALMAVVGFTFIIMAIFLRLKASENRSALVLRKYGRNAA